MTDSSSEQQGRIPPKKAKTETSTPSGLFNLVIIIGSLANFFVFVVAAYQIYKTNQIEQIRTLRELTTQFNDDPIYRNIRTSIDRCEHLYNGDLGLKFPQSSKGKYDWDQINHYLNFFDNLSFYESQRALTPLMINHSFGAWIIEANENNELRKYIDNFQRLGGEPRAFKDFQRIADILEEPQFDNEALVTEARKCSSH
jgi:hypothetical protein